MRKKFLLFVFVPLLILLVIVYLFIDGWIESAFESVGEGIVGARVEIDHLSLSLSPIAIEFSRLQVANPQDPWTNIFETGKVRFALNFGQLLRGKYIIETMEINNVIIGTKRSSDGSLPRSSTTPGERSFISEATSSLMQEVQKAPVFDLAKIRKELKIDSLLNVRNLRTVQYIDTLKLRLKTAEQQWNAVLADVDKSKQRVSEIQKSIAAINLNELKTVDKITAAVSNVNNAYKGFTDLNDTFKSRRTAVTDQINTLYSSVAVIDDLAKVDYESVRRLAQLPDLSTQGIAKLLVGREILQKVNTYLSWVDFARTNVPKYVPEPDYEAPPRFKGQDIHFPADRAYPKWWIKKVVLSGSEDKTQHPECFYAIGEVANVTNDQRLTGFPLTVSLSASKTSGNAFTVNASFDRRPDVPADNYRITASNLPAGDMVFGQADFVPSRIKNAIIQASAEASVPGNTFDAGINIAFQNLSLVFDRDARNDIERITRSVLASITAFNVSVRLWNTGGPLNVAFSTDLDNILAARTKGVIGDELARLQNEIRSKVNARIAEKRAEFDKLFNEKKEWALSQLRSYEGLIGQNLAQLDGKKKELEARVEQEKKKQTDAVKKQLEDAFKGLIKKR
jgi:uncharacterized protein (TIGR03545 family)